MVRLSILLLLLGCARAEAPLTVCAASSLREVAAEIAAGWERRSGERIVLRFEASSTLARQIHQGAPADLFLSADPVWAEAVRPADRFDWLGNRLVCVVPSGSADAPARAEDLASLPLLAMAGEQVPAGRYARAALGPNVPRRIVEGADVRDVLMKVAAGAPAGIVYATDAAVEPRVRVAFHFPPQRIVYPAALITPRGRALFDELRKPWVLDIARRRGFLIP